MTVSSVDVVLEAIKKGADPRAAIPDDFVIIRGGIGNLPPAGTTFSGAMGLTILEAGAGVPHNQIRVTTAGKIRTGGGTVEFAPEVDPRTGKPNLLHVNITEGGATSFSDPQANPVPKNQRLR